MPAEPGKQLSKWLVSAALPKLAVYFRKVIRILHAWMTSRWLGRHLPGRLLRAMKKNFWNYLPAIVLLGLSMALAPVFRAQSSGTLTRITPVPDGAQFTVDGQVYVHATSALWPEGSKHILAVPNTVQTGQIRTQLVFQGWQFGGVSLPLNPLPITASAAINEYQAVFTINYGLGVVFTNCPDPATCSSPGSIYVNGSPIYSSQDVYIGANSSATLQAYPNPGFVFAGWQPGANQAITGFQDVVTMTGPLTVYQIGRVA